MNYDEILELGIEKTASSMSTKDRLSSTLPGVLGGGAIGAGLSKGDPASTLAGTVIGGSIGELYGRNKQKNRHRKTNQQSKDQWFNEDLTKDHVTYGTDYKIPKHLKPIGEVGDGHVFFLKDKQNDKVKTFNNRTGKIENYADDLEEFKSKKNKTASSKLTAGLVGAGLGGGAGALGMHLKGKKDKQLKNKEILKARMSRRFPDVAAIDDPTKNNVRSFQSIYPNKINKEKELINNSEKERGNKPFGDSYIPIGGSGFGDAFLVDTSKEDMPVYFRNHELKDSTHKLSDSLTDFEENLKNKKWIGEKSKEANIMDYNKLVGLGLEKLAFNPEAGGFEGGAIRKGFNEKQKDEGGHLLPDFAKDLEKPKKVNSFEEADKPLWLVRKEKEEKEKNAFVEGLRKIAKENKLNKTLKTKADPDNPHFSRNVKTKFAPNPRGNSDFKFKHRGLGSFPHMSIKGKDSFNLSDKDKAEKLNQRAKQTQNKADLLGLGLGAGGALVGGLASKDTAKGVAGGLMGGAVAGLGSHALGKMKSKRDFIKGLSDKQKKQISNIMQKKNKAVAKNPQSAQELHGETLMPLGGGGFYAHKTNLKK